MEINTHPVVDVVQARLAIAQIDISKESMKTQFGGGLAPKINLSALKGVLVNTLA